MALSKSTHKGRGAERQLADGGGAWHGGSGAGPGGGEGSRRIRVRGGLARSPSARKGHPESAAKRVAGAGFRTRVAPPDWATRAASSDASTGTSSCRRSTSQAPSTGRARRFGDRERGVRPRNQDNSVPPVRPKSRELQCQRPEQIAPPYEWRAARDNSPFSASMSGRRSGRGVERRGRRRRER